LFLAGYGLPPRALAPTGVGVGPLTPHRQPPPVSHASIAADLYEPLDVHGDVSSEITLDHPLVLNDLLDPQNLVFGEVFDLDALTLMPSSTFAVTRIFMARVRPIP
jgi:hypothetical protein